MDTPQMKSAIEGLLFVAGDEGLDGKQLADVLEQDVRQVISVLQEMKEEYKNQARGIQIVEMAGTFQLTTLPEHAPFFERLAHSPTRTSLSQAALETLSIIAYKQPITRVEIEEIRGVKSDRALSTLVAKELIEEVGRAEAIGRPILYGTTKQFLDYFGLMSIDQLPEKDHFAQDVDLEEETRLLFEKLDVEQLTIDDINSGVEE
ncbi:SMC-Scp complex subunit ScpB [Paenibacillus sp. J2TS4]|uniref:SMC-Scp complex subunit ScpB n=1 Tax=Paenibacillus sp. J2TS4 TaxID=2807194 RepID=UPI001B09BE77|nr:SMC-Scp complex subunit ScpB [Paenibacillus sp. J2TS4]GIP32339.1 segregation and condensation protein B [Paenibacillus sp. J2TS4]